MGNKYRFNYVNEDKGDSVTVIKDFSAINSEGEDTDKLLTLFNSFLQQIGYTHFGILSTRSEDEYMATCDFINEYRRKIGRDNLED